MVKHAGRIVEDVSVDLAHGDDCLQGMAKGMIDGDEIGENEAERTPADLYAYHY